MAEANLPTSNHNEDLQNFINQLVGDDETDVNEKQIIDDSSNYVRYGNNGLIEKDTPEYFDWRKRNNEAIQRCRRKKAGKAKELKEKLISLTKENEQLKQEDEMLLDELIKLHKLFLNKGILSEEAEQLFDKLCELCKKAKINDEETALNQES